MATDRYVTVHVAMDLLAELGDWSEPVQVKITETPGRGTGYEMVARAARPELVAGPGGSRLNETLTPPPVGPETLSREPAPKKDPS